MREGMGRAIWPQRRDESLSSPTRNRNGGFGVCWDSNTTLGAGDFMKQRSFSSQFSGSRACTGIGVALEKWWMMLQWAEHLQQMDG